ncbi:hypothetical protein SAMN05421780_104238 [Flexibacter flexilis DSM 6793]|uniref:DUF6268 domain-containing protein n=1 Tax=Flexibacter flexilis DSM 6793 TaxID=927664 RepID=A0A1I1IDY6_9BACT|nr:DUF6268 family outer membrane beta-barrel protein [Flexibacter flexilis]SFC31933.1 hypothetical protein SAMN05421780_104238 [Flexibacter flexilis DSM 6793]
MKQFFCLGLTLLIGLSLQAQMLNDPVYVNCTWQPRTDIKNANSTLSQVALEMGVTMPLLQKTQTKLYQSVYYRNSNFSHKNIGLQAFSTIHDARYTLTLRQQLYKNFDVLVMPRLLLRSDLRQSVSHKDLFYAGVVSVNYAVLGNPNFKIGVGAALNNDFRHNAIILFGMLTYYAPKWRVEITPLTANVAYKLQNKWEAGLFVHIDGALSHIKSVPLADGSESQYLRNYQILVAPNLTYPVYKNIMGHLKIGVAPSRNYQYVDNDFEKIASTLQKMNNSFFVKAGFSFRINN